MSTVTETAPAQMDTAEWEELDKFVSSLVAKKSLELRLSVRIPVKTLAQLTTARRSLTKLICAELGVSRKGVRIPGWAFMLYSDGGAALCSYADDQATRVRAGKRERLHYLALHADVKAFVIARKG